MSIDRAFWIRTDVKGTMYRVAASPFTSGLRQDSVSLSAGGGEGYFQDGGEIFWQVPGKRASALVLMGVVDGKVGE